MDNRDDLIREARSGILQCQAQIDLYETSVSQHFDRFRELTQRIERDRDSIRTLVHDDIELLLQAAQVFCLRHLQGKFQDRLAELDDDSDE